ncbi:MAG TPA: insulinase family protein [Candidatus Eremiobacteraceae bacterium]|nr:insulinase family protein [Candidatus Eremiobacteraceae bacterium]
MDNRPIHIAAIAFFVAGSITAAPAYADSPAVARVTLDNGLRVVVERQATAPIATVSMDYLFGVADSPSSNAGLAFGVSEFMTRQVDGLNADQLSKLVGAVGGSVNVYTAETLTRFVSTVPSVDLPTILMLEAARMRGLGATSADWNLDRRLEAQNLRQLSTSYGYIWGREVGNALFPGWTPVRDIAMPDALGATPFADVSAFWNRWVGPNNAVLVVTGDVDPNSVVALAKSDFGSLRKIVVGKHDDQSAPAPHGATISIKGDVVARWAYACVELPGLGSQDYAAGQVIERALNAASADIHALALQGTAISANFSTVFQARQALVACGQASTGRDTDPKTVAKKMRDVLTTLAAQGLSESALESAKRGEELSLQLDIADAPDLAGYLGTASAEMADTTPEQYLAAVRAVTGTDIKRVAGQYLNADRIVVASSVTNVAPAATAKSQTVLSAASSNAPLPSWAAAASVPPETLPLSITPMDATLPNGLRVISVPIRGSGFVSVYGRVHVDANMEAPPGAEGVGLLLDRLIAQGPADMSPEAFARAVDEIGGQLHGGSSFQFSVAPPDFDRGLALLSDDELHPTFDDTAFANARSAVSANADNSIHTMGAWIGQTLNAHLFPPSDPSLRVANSDSVGALATDDAQAYYTAAFRPDRTVIVVIGDVDPSTASSEIGKWFGTWQRPVTPAPAVDLPAVPQNKPYFQNQPDPGFGYKLVTLEETLDVTPVSQQASALTAGVEALGGTLSGSRFARDIRDHAGLAFFVSDSLAIGPTRSTYSVRFVSLPANAEKIKGIILKDIRAMQTSPLSTADLTQVKALLIRQLVLQLDSPQSIAGKYLDLAVAGEPLNQPSLDARTYLTLTPDDVRAAFVKLVRAQGFVDLEVGGS